MHLAVAWVLNNPAVTSAIIGPRTMEQLTTQLGAADVDLDADVLDASTRSCRPGRTSPGPTPATPHPEWPTRHAVAAAEEPPERTGDLRSAAGAYRLNVARSSRAPEIFGKTVAAGGRPPSAPCPPRRNRLDGR